MPKGNYQRSKDLGNRISEGKRPGSTQEKIRVRELYQAGTTLRDIAQITGVPKSTVKNWIRDLPKHSTGFSQRRLGVRAARVARLTGRDGEVIRQEMVAKEHDACIFCGDDAFAQSGWFGDVFHHYEDGHVDRAHSGCNAMRSHANQVVTKVQSEDISPRPA